MSRLWYQALLLQITAAVLGGGLSHGENAAVQAAREAGAIVRSL